MPRERPRPLGIQAEADTYASEVYVAMPMDTDLDLLRLWEKAAQDMKLTARSSP